MFVSISSGTKHVHISYEAKKQGSISTIQCKKKKLANYNSLGMYECSKILEHFMYFTDLLLDLFNGLFSFLDESFIENNLVIQLQHLLPSA